MSITNRVRTNEVKNQAGWEARMARRFAAALRHPNYPGDFIDEKQLLDTARHLARHMARVKNPEGKSDDE